MFNHEPKHRLDFELTEDAPYFISEELQITGQKTCTLGWNACWWIWGISQLLHHIVDVITYPSSKCNVIFANFIKKGYIARQTFDKNT